MKEAVTKAWAVKRDLDDAISDRPVVAYEVWYRTELTGAPEMGTGLENFFIVYEGEVSGRFWNLAQHIAGKLNNKGE